MSKHGIGQGTTHIYVYYRRFVFFFNLNSVRTAMLRFYNKHSYYTENSEGGTSLYTPKELGIGFGLWRRTQSRLMSFWHLRRSLLICLVFICLFFSSLLFFFYFSISFVLWSSGCSTWDGVASLINHGLAA